MNRAKNRCIINSTFKTICIDVTKIRFMSPLETLQHSKPHQHSILSSHDVDDWLLCHQHLFCHQRNVININVSFITPNGLNSSPITIEVTPEKSGFVKKFYVNLIKVTYFQNFKLISYLRRNFRPKLKPKIDQNFAKIESEVS